MADDKRIFFLWCDLETTGLDPSRDSILEAAFTLTNNRLDVIWNEDFVIGYVGLVADKFVQEMHTKNGLLAECAKSEDSIDFVDGFIARRLEASIAEWHELILAGSTVHFDRSFLRRTKKIDALLNHRHLDVSVFKTAARASGISYPTTLDGGASAHRARPDIEHSITLFRHWRHVLASGVSLTEIPF